MVKLFNERTYRHRVISGMENGKIEKKNSFLQPSHRPIYGPLLVCFSISLTVTPRPTTLSL